jgi:hypothetical protein
LLAGCTPVSWAEVSVRPRVFDRGHDAWYVEIVEQRASGLRLVHAGYVCGSIPVHFTIDVRCADETELTGEVWRMPDHAACGAPPPVLLRVEAERLGGVRVAALREQTIFRGHRASDCEDARPETITLWPPVVPTTFWREDDYWIAPEDADYQLETR